MGSCCSLTLCAMGAMMQWTQFLSFLAILQPVGVAGLHACRLRAQRLFSDVSTMALGWPCGWRMEKPPVRLMGGKCGG